MGVGEREGEGGVGVPKKKTKKKKKHKTENKNRFVPPKHVCMFLGGMGLKRMGTLWRDSLYTRTPPLHPSPYPPPPHKKKGGFAHISCEPDRVQ